MPSSLFKRNLIALTAILFSVIGINSKAQISQGVPVIYDYSCASGIYNLAEQTCLTSGGGSGTVTSLTEGFGITLSPSTITTTGSVGIGASNANGFLYDDGSSNLSFTGINTDATMTGSGTVASPLHVASQIDSTVGSANTISTAQLNNTGTYNNGTGGVGATLTANIDGPLGTINGFAVITGSTILVNGQGSQLQNGLYDVTDAGDGSNPWLLTRDASADTSDNLTDGQVQITGGTFAGDLYFQGTLDPTVGVSNIVYTVFIPAFVTESAAGTQTQWNIPLWSAVTGQLTRGTDYFQYNSNTNVFTIGGIGWVFPPSHATGFFASDIHGNITIATTLPESTIIGTPGQVPYFNNSGGQLNSDTMFLRDSTTYYSELETPCPGMGRTANQTDIFLAANLGTNGVSLVFNGSDNVTTVVGNWNSANPGNLVSQVGGSGSDVPTSQTVNLYPGSDSSFNTGYQNSFFPLSGSLVSAIDAASNISFMFAGQLGDGPQSLMGVAGGSTNAILAFSPGLVGIQQSDSVSGSDIAFGNDELILDYSDSGTSNNGSIGWSSGGSTYLYQNGPIVSEVGLGLSEATVYNSDGSTYDSRYQSGSGGSEVQFTNLSTTTTRRWGANSTNLYIGIGAGIMSFPDTFGSIGQALVMAPGFNLGWGGPFALASSNLSGTYVPTITSNTNIAGYTNYQCQYNQVASVVTVSGEIDITATAPGPFEIGFSFPVASNITIPGNVGGTFMSAQSLGGTIYGETAFSDAGFAGVAADNMSHAYYFSFTYLVIP